MPCQLPRNNRPTLAYFVTSHGFGHAARASAVIKALLNQNPNIQIIIFTQSPKWFFQDTLSNHFDYISVQTDVGMVQHNPTREDLGETIDALCRFKNTFDAQSRVLATRLTQLNCSLVLCDISPLGLAAAAIAKIPSVLIENFTWDWIYNNYQSSAKAALSSYSNFMGAAFDSATYRIQTRPVCEKVQADLYTLPVSRAARTSAAAIRSRLGVALDRPLVMITMGGVSADFQFIGRLEKLADICFVITGVGPEKVIRNNVILLPKHSTYYHPDLIHAGNAVIGKVGYSTLAEVYHAGLPFGYVARPMFPESPKLLEFIEREMVGIEFEEAGFYQGDWIEQVHELINLKSSGPKGENGADQIAAFIIPLLSN